MLAVEMCETDSSHPSSSLPSNVRNPHTSKQPFASLISSLLSRQVFHLLSTTTLQLLSTTHALLGKVVPTVPVGSIVILVTELVVKVNH